jgi:hypothetical protein
MAYALESQNDSLLENDENRSYIIPTWDDLRSVYDAKWLEQKEKFHTQLKDNFRALVSQYKSGPQEIFELSQGTYTKHYEQAFRELFADTGYQATVGATEKLGTGNKRCRKLYVTLPPCHN